MALVKKKPKKKEILKKEDEFISTTMRIINYVRRNRRRLTTIAICVILAAAMAFAYTTYKSNREKDASGAFAMAVDFYYNRLASSRAGSSAPEKAVYSEALKKFEEIVKNYRGTRIWGTACLYAANCSYWAEKYDSAIRYYLLFLKDNKDDTLYNELGWSGLAYSYMAKKDYNNAEKYFKMIIDREGAEKPYAYYNLARIYNAQGKTAEAEKVIETLAREFPDLDITSRLKRREGS